MDFQLIFILYFYRHSVRVYYIGSNHFLQLLWNQLLYSFLYGFTTNLSYLIFQMNPRNSHDSDKFILANIIHIVLTSKLMNDSSPLKKRKNKKKFINRVQTVSINFRWILDVMEGTQCVQLLIGTNKVIKEVMLDVFGSRLQCLASKVLNFNCIP